MQVEGWGKAEEQEDWGKTEEEGDWNQGGKEKLVHESRQAEDVKKCQLEW